MTIMTDSFHGSTKAVSNKDNKKQSTVNLLYWQAHTKCGIEIENVF